MKTIRLATFALVFVIIFSVWTPGPALARTEPAEAGKARLTIVSLTVLNRTFGALIVTLEGSGGSYNFYVPQGKSTYQISPGKYTLTVNFSPYSICKGWFSDKHLNSLVKTKTFNNLKNTIGPYRVCSLR